MPELIRIEQLLIVRDANGWPCNIGVWDYQMVQHPDTGEEYASNPYPIGGTESIEDVGIYSDGSRRVVNA